MFSSVQSQITQTTERQAQEHFIPIFSKTKGKVDAVAITQTGFTKYLANFLFPDFRLAFIFFGGVAD